MEFGSFFMPHISYCQPSSPEALLRRRESLQSFQQLEHVLREGFESQQLLRMVRGCRSRVDLPSQGCTFVKCFH